MPMTILSDLADRCRYYASLLNYDLIRLALARKNNDGHDRADHLEAAVAWICRAQDAIGDGGVARSRCLAYNRFFKSSGWIPSYPETTGYIIPTMFDYARLTSNKDVFARAVTMADWECDAQMEEGAVQGGTIDQAPTPAIFNTGQVIFGWVRAAQETGQEKYWISARRAGQYLVSQQEQDGSWRKNLSRYASGDMPFYTYNTRTAWSLLELWAMDNDPVCKSAGIRNIEFALDQQQENGWFRSNCLNDPTQPLLHTIAYCIRGILEAGILLNDQRYISRARTAADALLKKQRDNGSLAGRFDHQWEPTVSWSCLTGDAQISIIWGRLYQVTGEARYADAMSRVNRYLRSVQILATNNADLYGGISGSDPVFGGYGKFEILNWGVKFFLDALMLEQAIEERNGNGRTGSDI